MPFEHIVRSDKQTKLTGAGVPNSVAATELTIADGAITPDRASHIIDTEGDAENDNLETINPANFKAGDILLLYPANDDRGVTIKHNVGNIQTPSEKDFELDSAMASVHLRYNGSDWIVIENGGQGIESVADFAAMRALKAPAEDGALVNMPGVRGGQFVWNSSDLSGVKESRSDGAMTSGSRTLTGSGFTDGHREAVVVVDGAGPGGSDLVCLLDVQSGGTSATLTHPAETTVASATYTIYGPDFSDRGIANFETSGAEGVCILPDSDPTGASGGWIRQDYLIHRILRPEWFGAVGDGSTDDHAAFQAMINFSFWSGAHTSPLGSAPAAMRLNAGPYYISTTLRLKPSHHGFTLIGEGTSAKIWSPVEDLLFQVGQDTRTANWPDTDQDDQLGTIYDKAGMYQISEGYVANIEFRSFTPNSQNSCAWYFTNPAFWRFENCKFKDWYIHMDWHAQNRCWINKCFFDGTARSVNSSLAFLRFSGMYDSAVGGQVPCSGMHITNCEGGGPAAGFGTNQRNVMVIHSMDTIYLLDNHFKFYRTCIRVNPTDSPHNIVITGIEAVKMYFDHPSTAGDGQVEFIGTLKNGGLFQIFNFIKCLFRGANDGAEGFVCRMSDAGDFESNGFYIEEFNFSECIFRQQKQGIVFNGQASGHLNAIGAKVTACTFEDNNHNDDVAYSDIFFDGRSILIDGNYFHDDQNVTQYNIGLDLRGSDEAAVGKSAILSNNDFSRSNYDNGSTRPWNIILEETDTPALNISGNIMPRIGVSHSRFEETQTYYATTENDEAVIMWDTYMRNNHEHGVLRFDGSGISRDNQLEQAYVADAHAFYRRQHSGAVAMLDRATPTKSHGIAGLGSLMAPIWPVHFDGGAHADSTFFGQRTIIANGGNCYIALDDGTTGTGTPPTHTSGRATDGTVEWLYIGPQNSRRIGVIAFGEDTRPMTWNVNINYHASSVETA